MYRPELIPRIADYPYDERVRSRRIRHDSPLSGRQRLWLVVAALIVVLVLGAAWAVAASAAPAHPSKAACTPGAKTIGGAPARVFCGPAKATARLGGTAYRFANGACQKAPGFTVNLGTLSFAASSPVAYLGISLPQAKAGTYAGRQVTVSFSTGKRRVSLRTDSAARVVLHAGLHSGTFSGADLSGKKVTGSFSC
jgi:hypothetical protein